MLGLMRGTPRKSEGAVKADRNQGVFARLDSKTVGRLDEIEAAMRPVTSRSAVTAILIQRFVDERQAEVDRKGWIKMVTRVVVGSVAIVLGLAAGAHAQYSVGYTWNRFNEWVDRPAVDNGTSNGNPSADFVGNPVWLYQWIDGGGPLGSAQPWYTLAGVNDVWNSMWFGMAPAWSRAPDVSPPIFQDSLLHDLDNELPLQKFSHAPALSWISPIGRTAKLSVSGMATVSWGGATGGFPTAVDVVVVDRHAAAGGTTVLYQSTFTKPTPDSSYQSIDIPLSLSTIVSPGDSIMLSLRGYDPHNSNWMQLYDRQLNYQITALPLPGDANADGTVNFADLLTLAQHYGASQATWRIGDFNNDGRVGFDDLLLLAQNYGAGTAASPAPEPMWIVSGALLMMVRIRPR
jgi:hypothetical protein